jgi:peptidoglycan/xylan/chitin deacetylase (PgdA/CDA1 family)
MPLFSELGLETDVRAAEVAITEIVGVDPRPWFRCPFGAGSNESRILSGLKALGYTDVGWNVSPDDWDVVSTAQSVEETVVRGALEQGDGSVVLMHTWPMPTTAALPGIIGRLRDAGAEFVSVDQLPGPPPKRPE